MHVQDIILRLQNYWSKQGCAILQPLDMPVGAGTFHPATMLRALGPHPWQAVYVQPSRRPTDSRFGKHPNRLQHYYQLQVVLKPPPDNFQELYLASLQQLGIKAKEHDIRFVEDDWKSPTLGAWGLGWEVWCDGMEITQFTYFQEVGGIKCQPVMGEITYGVERLAMYLQDCDDVYQLRWHGNLHYGDLYMANEQQQSAYNVHGDDNAELQRQFEQNELACSARLEKGWVLPAYEAMLVCSHSFNLLDARGCYSADERAAVIVRVRRLSCAVAKAWLASVTAEVA